MTPEERSILQSFLADLGSTPNVTKDAEAEAMIEDAIKANPDAAYLLVQHAILADQALHAAQAQLAGRAQPGSFLSPAPSAPSAPAPSGVAPADAPAMAPGGASGNVWGDRGGTLSSGSGDAPYGGQAYGGPWAGQGGGPIQSSPFAANSGLGGFLRGAGQMAVGVAAGDFLFQGIENIFSPRW
jgi:uncharacterized protein